MTRRREEPRPCLGMRRYAGDRTADLLRRAAFQANRAGRLKDEESVHDLRVAIRRLTHALRLFSQFFPRAEVRRLRRRLAAVLDTAAAVRDCDVALNLVQAAGIPADSPLTTELNRRRSLAEHELLEALAGWKRHEFEKKWRRRLEL